MSNPSKSSNPMDSVDKKFIERVLNQPFTTGFDLPALRMSMKGESEIRFYNEIPKFVDDTYKYIMEWFRFNVDEFKPEFLVKIGGRTDTVVFKCKDNAEGLNPEDKIGRIFVNLGPDDNFRLSKVTGTIPSKDKAKPPKEIREFDEFFLAHNNGRFYSEAYNSHDIILYGNPRRYLIQREKSVNSKKQVWFKESKVYRIRPDSHVTVMMVINLWINMDLKLAKLNASKVKVIEGPGNFNNDSDSDEEPIVKDTDEPIGRM